MSDSDCQKLHDLFGAIVSTNCCTDSLSKASCDDDFRVTSLSLSHFGLNGRLPDLSGLMQLTHLDLSWNNFTDVIPQPFVSCDGPFKYLNLSQNSVTGNIPKDLLHCGIAELDLTWNYLQDASDFNIKGAILVPQKLSNVAGTNNETNQSQLPPVPNNPDTSNNNNRIGVITAASVTGALAIIGIIAYFEARRKQRTKATLTTAETSTSMMPVISGGSGRESRGLAVLGEREALRRLTRDRAMPVFIANADVAARPKHEYLKRGDTVSAAVLNNGRETVVSVDEMDEFQPVRYD